MTNTLLIIIAVLLAVRIVLQLRQGKRAFEKMYCAPSKVENCVNIVENNHYEISNVVERMATYRWEFVSAYPTKDDKVLLFFTRKKIKNYYEE